MRTYFDHASSSPVRETVVKFLASGECRAYLNPSSVHYEGQKSKSFISNARETLSQRLNVDFDNFLFTSSGTESCNYIINLAVEALNVENFIYLPTEHTAVIDAISSKNLNNIICPVNNNGLIDIDYCEEIMKQTKGKKLLCAMHINNETGIIQPIEQISELCRRHEALFFCDMIQSLGKVDIDLKKMQVDFASFASHKIGGVHGVGAVYMKDASLLHKDILGGSQEFGRRGGTENVIGISAFGVALEDVYSNMEQEKALINKLNLQMTKGLHNISQDIIIVSQGSNKVPSISSILFPGLKSENLLIGLDMDGFAVSSGAACSSGKVGNSHVLEAMGYNENESSGAIRISFGWGNNEQQVTLFLNALNNLLKGMNFKD